MGQGASEIVRQTQALAWHAPSRLELTATLARFSQPSGLGRPVRPVAGRRAATSRGTFHIDTAHERSSGLLTHTPPIDTNRFLRRWTIGFAHGILRHRPAARHCRHRKHVVADRSELPFRGIRGARRRSLLLNWIALRDDFCDRQHFSRRIQAAQFLQLQAAPASFDPALERHVSFVCWHWGSSPRSRGLFPRLVHSLLLAAPSASLLALRYLCVQAAVHGSRTGILSGRRIFLFGTGRHIDDFVARYQPKAFGVNIVGCHFLTPTAAGAPAHARRQALAERPRSCGRQRAPARARGNLPCDALVGHGHDQHLC